MIAPHDVESLSGRRLTPLAACLSAALALGALHPMTALATTRNVANCNDDNSSGSLRNVIAASSSGDTVSLTSLSACTITLGSQITIPSTVTGLKIQGPANNSVAVNGQQAYRVFDHQGTGTLSIYHLVIENGKYKAANANGGCIVSAGSVSLHSTTMTGCVAYGNSASGKARGGAIHAAGTVTLANSTISGNAAQGFGSAFGGGVDAHSLSMQYSSVTGNYARFPSGASPGSNAVFDGGGVYVGTGSTSITNSTIANDTANGAQNDQIATTANGGCIFAKGSVYIGTSDVYGCFAGSHDKTQGGGIFASGTLTLSHTTLSANYAAGTDGAYGGGLRANSLIATYSTIHANQVGAGPYGFCCYFEGGGAFVYTGSTQISNSTMDENSSVGAGGGLFTVSSNITVNSSTISGNKAYSNGSVNNGAGGIHMAGAAATLHVSNSTIAFNYGSGRSNAPTIGGGVSAFGTAVIESSILSNNTFRQGLTTSASDIDCNCGTNAAKTISGANDLIMAVDTTSGVAMPAGMVIVTADPLLVPLSEHGGETRTHALPAGSPAIGLGNNVPNFTYDQRGIGYPRLNGGLADMGAYERQPNDDEIFYNGLQ